MRRALPLLALALLLPAASAGVELGAGRIVEGALLPGEDVTLAMPLDATRAGFLYAKLLATPGNAVNDGTRANGSVEDATGWRISFAIVRSDGAREPLGTFVDSTSTPLVAVAEGERVTLESTLHVPADAAAGGATQRAWVAVAYRAPSDGPADGASGATMDEARSIALVLSGALAPPAPEQPTPDPTTGEEAPPVGPIDESTPPAGTPTRVDASLPGWFLVGLLVTLAAIAAALAAQAVATRALLREVRARQPETPRRVHVNAAEEPEPAERSERLQR